MEQLHANLARLYSSLYKYHLPEDETDFEALSLFMTRIATNPALQTSEELLKFLFDEAPYGDQERPTVFSCAGLESWDRSDIAELPVTHICAIAAHVDVSLNRCLTRLEYADRIVARLTGNDEDMYDNDNGERLKSLGQLEDERMKSKAPAAGSAAPSPEKDATPKPTLPMKVPVFLEMLGMVQYTARFAENGYDDLRIATQLLAKDLLTMGVEKDDVDKLLRAGLEWQATARKHNVLSNWTRSLHRANETGVLELGASPER
jgi:hypothetical protein